MRRSNRAVCARLACLAACLATAGCGPPAQPAPEPEPAGLRIVSLSPAISRTCVDLGLTDRIVGRSAFCSFLPQHVPAVGSLYEIDLERLIRLQPSHVLVQPPSGGIDPALVRLADRYGFALGQWRLETISDIERVLTDLPATLYGPGQLRDEAENRGRELLEGIAAALEPAGEEVFEGRTMLVAGVDPIMVFGRQTYLDDIMSALGGSNAVSLSGWPELSLEDVIRIDPEAIVVVRPTDAEDPPPQIGGLGDLDITAVREGRIAVLAHPDALYPSTGIIGVATAMRRVMAELVRAGS